MWHEILLGLLQGVTEFLPVSSSAHLVLAQTALGWREPSLSFDLLLHVATMAATLLFFRKELCAVAADWFGGWFSPSRRERPGWRYGWAVLAGTLVTVAVALPLKSTVERLFASPLAVGCALLVTASLLEFGTGRRPSGETGPEGATPRRLSVGVGLWVGLVQGLAAVPGISRSGSTIVAGQVLGLSREEAFRFSFLLSLPAIAGAALLQVRDLGGMTAFLADLPEGWLPGALVAFVAGYAALVVLRRVVLAGRLRGFALYCALLGSGAVALSLAGRL